MVTLTVREPADICGDHISKVAYVRLSSDLSIMWSAKATAKKFLFVHVTESNVVFWGLRERTVQIRSFKKYRLVKAA